MSSHFAYNVIDAFYCTCCKYVHHVGPGRCGPWEMRALGDAGPGRCGPWEMRALGAVVQALRRKVQSATRCPFPDSEQECV